MPDIQLRFHKDMLVLSAPVDAALAARGFTEGQEREVLLATEPETLLEPLRLELMAGAQCLVLPTAGITRARLAHLRAEDAGQQIAAAALRLAREVVPVPQHVLAEIGPCGLPLDTTLKTSLVANRDQYAHAARLFEGASIDGIFLNGFTSVADLRCALMGVRKVADVPVFASVCVNTEGCLAGSAESLEEALAIMEEYGAQVAGMQSAAPPESLSALVERMKQATSLPLLVQIEVGEVCAKEPLNVQTNPYWCADVAMQAAQPLRQAGVQFLQACGQATPAYTGALVAATAGLDVVGCA